jgi:hypothetical protein
MIPLLFSTLRYCPILDAEGHPVGQLKDLFLLPLETLPLVTKLVIQTVEKEELIVPWETVAHVEWDPVAIHQAPGWRGGFALPFRSIALAFRQTFEASYSSLPFDARFGLLFIALACRGDAKLLRSYVVYSVLSLPMPLFTVGGCGR